MTNLNQVILMGNLVRDCGSDERDFGYVANGQARASITIAVNRSKKVGDEWQDETSFFDVTVWGKTAENLKPYFVKGQKVAIQGYLKQDRWEKDGQKHSRISIVAEHVELCGAIKKDGGNNAAPVQNNVTQNQPVFSGSTANGFQEDIPYGGDPESIPF